ncbi:unnamed protein product [Aphis gossypii]|uniref:Uncharacterized protein n=1 Tax=Aphis gossypii TaxID=80765 RepID=A0A9P0NC46_APHGO|nr:unnamed protein product [Aphis gossypii]
MVVFVIGTRSARQNGQDEGTHTRYHYTRAHTHAQLLYIRQWQKQQQQQQWRARCAIRHICEKSPGGLIYYTNIIIAHTYEKYYRPSCRRCILYIYRYGKKGRPKSITCPGGARSPSRSIISCACVCVFIYLATTIYI